MSRSRMTSDERHDAILWNLASAHKAIGDALAEWREISPMTLEVLHNRLDNLRRATKGLDYGTIDAVLRARKAPAFTDLSGVLLGMAQTAPHALDLERTTDGESNPDQGPDTP